MQDTGSAFSPAQAPAYGVPEGTSHDAGSRSGGVNRGNLSYALYGMPIIDADGARAVLAIERTMNPGSAGIANAFSTADDALMVFGDAKAVISDVAGALRAEQEGQAAASRGSPRCRRVSIG